MRFFPLTILIHFALLQAALSDFVFPPDIASGISKSRTGENGGLSIDGVERGKFLDYVCAHWREIAENIESLPKAEGDFVTKEGAFNCAVETFGAACEWLPPNDYLDFMDKFIELYAEKRINFRPFDSQLGASAKKEDFLSVNWEHPRVKAIFAKARRLIPPTEVATLSWIDEAAAGKLADNYMTNKPDEAPLPETLPGIKLKRPWGSLIKKYEWMTGKKVDVPYDPRYNTRPDKQAGDAREGTSISDENTPLWLAPWFWMIVGGLTLIIGLVVRARHNSK